ncbi:uncharacterized protein TNCV_2345221 [Trichonephila clavipes]|nr:uncharacterized protein TNCV_2345221 [Trichonephila clavipes]
MDETLGSSTALRIIGIYVTIYVTVALPGGVSFVFFSQARAVPFATTDFGLIRMDSSCVSPQRERDSNCWTPFFDFI